MPVAPGLDAEEAELLRLINEYRAANGRSAVGVNTNLTSAADWLSGDMARYNRISHWDSLGRDPNERAWDFGYSGPIGEIITADPNATAAWAFNTWKRSPGHNAIMLDPYYRGIGIGRASGPLGWYWAVDFGDS